MFEMRDQYGDVHTAFIQAALHVKGFKHLKDVAIKHGCPPSTFSNVWQKPYERFEKIVAEELGKKPEELWPSRYPNNNEVA
ncbi:TPA: helix-turn-helix domain-containing protein [Vibrio cholerae]